MNRSVTIAAQVVITSALGYYLYKAISARRQLNGKSAQSAVTAPLTPEQIALIKATVPVLEQHGVTITTVFYRNMLAAHPELNDVFNTANQANGHQQRALAGALLAYASHIDNLAVLGPAVELICNKHASLYIQPRDYEIVGKYLLEAMGEVLGDALTDDLRNAWATAYWALANLMIDREAALYRASHGWTDWRDFVVARKEPESDEITSFYLRPADHQPLPPFSPGQYISVRVNVPELNTLQPRQYSLSDQPQPDYYRISVKRESGRHPQNPGYVSNVLHDRIQAGDTVQVSHPFGDFFLSAQNSTPANTTTTTTPVVLISAGVGLTPLMSMLNTTISSTRPIHFIHGSRSSSARAFHAHLQAQAAASAHLKVTLFTSQPAASDKQGADYHFAGRVDLDKLDNKEDLFLSDPRTEYYICGPETFMTDVAAALAKRQVGAERIKMELFGTGSIN